MPPAARQACFARGGSGFRLPALGPQTSSHLINVSRERVLQERVVLLVLARSQEIDDTQDDVGNRAETPEEAYRIKGDQVQAHLRNLRGAEKIPLLFFDVVTDDHTAMAKAFTQHLGRMRAAHAERIAEVGQVIEELIKRHDEAQTKAAHDQVRRQLRIFVGRHRELSPRVGMVHEPFINAIGRTHVRTVWATTRRKGSWPGLDAYHFLGVGTAMDAQRRSEAAFSGLEELLRNMLGDDSLSPARDYVGELLRNIPVWKERFLGQATSAGREHFKAVMWQDDGLWDECVGFWGQGAGYRNRVASHLRVWCEAQSSVHDLVEKRVQESWRGCFVSPLADLCGAEEFSAEESAT